MTCVASLATQPHVSSTSLAIFAMSNQNSGRLIAMDAKLAAGAQHARITSWTFWAPGAASGSLLTLRHFTGQPNAVQAERAALYTTTSHVRKPKLETRTISRTATTGRWNGRCYVA